MKKILALVSLIILIAFGSTSLLRRTAVNCISVCDQSRKPSTRCWPRTTPQKPSDI